MTQNPGLTEERRIKLTRWLDDAEEAYQRATTGAQELSVSHGNSASNSAISFQGVAPATILARINDLRRELGMEPYNQLRPFVPCNY